MAREPVAQPSAGPAPRPAIWTAWLQGADRAPDMARRIFALWRAFNPGHDLHVVEQAEADAILDELGIRQVRMTPQVTADIVRTYKLMRLGGTWVDATLLPTRPLADWLDAELTREGFFAFRSTGDPNLVLQNWFLHADAGNPLITAWAEDYFDYFRSPRYNPTWKRALWHGRPVELIRHRRAWKRRDTLWFAEAGRGRSCSFFPYAIHNYCLAHVLSRRSDIRALWDRVPHRGHAAPQVIGWLSRDAETPRAAFEAAAVEVLPIAPVHKLRTHPDLFDRVIAQVEAGL